MTARPRAVIASPAPAEADQPRAGQPRAGQPRAGTARRVLTLLLATLEAARPRQWPKNLLVFAAPLAGASLGRDDGFAYALSAAVAFTAASAAVYLVNDVVDAERDRNHPAKRHRAVASGRLPAWWALAVAVAAVAVAIWGALLIRSPGLAALLGAYVVFSVLYSFRLKHLPGVEAAFVAVGFVLRALGGAVATRVPPSAWFLAVCSLGALMVALGKRYTELSVLGDDAWRHRPVMRFYRLSQLRTAQRVVAAAMLTAYVLWAVTEPVLWMRGWHLASALPLAVSLQRFDRLTGLAEDRPVEDLIVRDPVMLCAQVTWLTLFLVGL